MWSSTGRAARAIACGLAITVAPAAATAKSATSAVTAHTRSGKKGVQSVGAPNSGHLVGAARLKGSKTLHQREGAHSWALPQLVQLLHHAATEVARKHRGSQMFVGDLSGRTGGHLDHHGSHQTGRDADVGFYVMNSRGKPMAVKRFIPFDDAGNARDVQGVRFDEARTWTMVEAMLKDEKAGVRYMFITNGLRAKLLAHAARKHVAKALIEKAAKVMMSPQDADLHDDHIHVRIACPESMRDVCIEEATARVASAKGGDADPGADPVNDGAASGPKPRAPSEPVAAEKVTPTDNPDAPGSAGDAK
jgi:penicillin-insensitive murein DD-endopeptidase